MSRRRERYQTADTYLTMARDNAKQKRDIHTQQYDDLETPEEGDCHIGDVMAVKFAQAMYCCGTVRWIGKVPNVDDTVLGLEMDEVDESYTHGNYIEQKCFKLEEKKAFFRLMKLTRRTPFKVAEGDSRWPLSSHDIPQLVKVQPPQNGVSYGPNHGIQGDCNSCYMDATLFSMFSYSTMFDDILHKPYDPSEHHEKYPEVQRVLKEGIVNPLRRYCFVTADKVWALRNLLDKISSVKGMRGEQKDPEEFVNSLFEEVMKAEPFLHLANGQKSNYFQVFYDKGDADGRCADVQTILEGAFTQQELLLKEIPKCLILQMPRFGKDFSLFDRIIPNLDLDITSILENGFKLCDVCGKPAAWSGKFGRHNIAKVYCGHCISPKLKVNAKRINIGYNETTEELHKNFPKYEQADLRQELMKLSAVICIETSHYVAFVRCGKEADSKWVFFDSMADRVGNTAGYNVPCVTPVKVADWITNYNKEFRNKTNREMGELPRRFFCDNFVVIYESPLSAMY